MRLPFVLLHVVVLRALITRGWRWLAVIPGVVLLFLALRYYQRQQHLGPIVAEQLFASFQTYGLAAARTILVLGCRQLLRIFGMLTMEVPLRFLGIHLMGFLFSIIIGKQDAQTAFHRGWRISGGLLTMYGVSVGGRSLLPDLIAGRIAVTMAVYAFIIYILKPVGYVVSRKIAALLFVFIQLTILIYVTHRSDTFSVWTVLGEQIYLGILYRMIYAIRTTRRSITGAEPEEDILYTILRGERLQDRKQLLSGSETIWSTLLTQAREELKPLMDALPVRVFTTLGVLNMVAMLVQLGLFITAGADRIGWEMETVFRSSVAVYIVNYSLLQQQGISTRGQRLLVFLLVNFGIYLTIYHLVGSVPVYLVGCGIVWSLLNAVIMIQSRQSGNRLGLSADDYWYRLVGNMVAVMINTYFIFLLPVSLQLRFTLVMMYRALQFLLLRYQVQGLGVPTKKGLMKSG